MALDVRQTVALPLDGQQVDPSTFLEAWVSGIQIFNMPVGAFSGGALQFVYSQTDAPSTDERRVGLLWFRRGNGRLYMWDEPDPTDFAGPSNVRDFVSLSDRRDIWVRSAAAAPIGTPMTIDTSLSGSRFLASIAIDPGFPPVSRWIWPCFPLNAGDASNPLLPHLSEFVVVALDTGIANGLVRCCEHGFCDFRMQSGMTGAGGLARLLGGDGFQNVDNWSVLATAQTEVTGMVKGFYTDSSATAPGTNWTRPGYLFLSPPIGVTPNY